MKARKKRSIIWTIPKDELQKVLNNSSSLAEALRHFGLNKGNNINTLKRRIESEDLDVSHIPKGLGHNLNRKYINRQKTLKECESEIFIDRTGFDGTVPSPKKYIMRFGLMEEKCFNCNTGTVWNEKPLVLHLDHINGNHEDNRLENLRFLCPNCHSQTKTYAGRRFKKRYNCSKCGCEKKTKTSKLCNNCSQIENGKLNRKFEISNFELINLVCVEKIPYTTLGKRFNVSGNAIKKRSKRLGIDTTHRIYRPVV